jgi:hypothetical protein
VIEDHAGHEPRNGDTTEATGATPREGPASYPNRPNLTNRRSVQLHRAFDAKEPLILVGDDEEERCGLFGHWLPAF